jgi:hypothetical protein
MKGNFFFSGMYVIFTRRGSLFNDAFSTNIPYSVDDKVTSELWLIDDEHLCLKRDSNPRSQRQSDQGLLLRPRGLWDRPYSQDSCPLSCDVVRSKLISRVNAFMQPKVSISAQWYSGGRGQVCESARPPGFSGYLTGDPDSLNRYCRCNNAYWIFAEGNETVARKFCMLRHT